MVDDDRCSAVGPIVCVLRESQWQRFSRCGWFGCDVNDAVCTVLWSIHHHYCRGQVRVLKDERR
jgi:hypothetical protein